MSWFVGFAMAAAVVAVVASDTAGAQAPAPAKTVKAPSRLPRTPDGRPDLQGVWSYATITPIERPADLAGKATLTKEEAAAYEKLTIERGNKDSRPADKLADVNAAYNDFWWDRGTNFVGGRTSLVVDPPDGLIPPMTPQAKARVAAVAEARQRRGPADGPEDRSLAERCLVSLNAGPPMLPSAYNNNIQVFQTPTTIGITNEMIHNFRIVPLDGRALPDKSVELLMGASRGHWEGDTLVVETTNFRQQGTFRRLATPGLRVTERFTRVDAKTLMYRFTMEDPETWTRPWSGEIPMMKIEDKIFEYACHEGNRAMTNMLAGTRAEEQRAVKGSE